MLPFKKEKILAGLVLYFGLLYFGLLLFMIFNKPPFVDEKNLTYNIFYFAINRTFIPLYANYPTFYSYFIAIPCYFVLLIAFFIKGYPLEGLNDPYFLQFVFFQHDQLLFYTSKMISLLLVFTTFFIIWKSAKHCYGRFVALLSLLILFLDPVSEYFMHAQYALPEILITLLIFVIMIMCLKYIHSSKKGILLFASFLGGLAMSAKLNGGLSF